VNLPDETYVSDLWSVVSSFISESPRVALLTDPDIRLLSKVKRPQQAAKLRRPENELRSASGSYGNSFENIRRLAVLKSSDLRAII
jgi:hypothetical protein